MKPLQPVNPATRVILGVSFFVLFVAAWALATFGGFVEPLFLADPLKMLRSGWTLLTEMGFAHDIGMTVWHELAHVFHIQMSKSHVPRWFTEGLAEYETLAERPEWSREHDPALYEALRSGRLPKVGAMSQAFTRAEEMSDVATAYYASSQIMVMLVDKHGMPAADQMLKLWGEGKGTPEVVQTALGMSTDAFDTEFRSWADQKLARYKTQFVPISRTGGYEKVKEAAEKAKIEFKPQE